LENLPPEVQQKVNSAANQIMETENSLNEASANRQIDITDQSPGKTIMVSSVTLLRPGFVAISTVGHGLSDTNIGISTLLSAGVHKNISIPLTENVKGVQLNASLWEDNGDGVFNDKTDQWAKDEKYGLRVDRMFYIKTR
jgi:hypothetical protein